MPEVYPHRRSQRRKHRTLPALRLFFAACGVLFLTNIAAYAYYLRRTYPNTYAGEQKVGNRTQQGVAAVLDTPGVSLIPESIALTHGKQSQTVKLADLGIREDTGKLGPISHATNWLALWELWQKHTLPAPISVAQDTLETKATSLKTVFHTDPVDATLSFHNETFQVTEAKDGYELNTKQLGDSITSALRAGKRSLDIPITTLTASVATKALQSEAQKLNAQIQTSLTYSYKGSSRTPDVKTIAGWYTKAGNTYDVSDVALGNYLLREAKQLGVQPANVRTIMAQTKTALASNKTTDFTFTQYAQTKTMRYCVAVRGVDQAALDGLRSKLAQTLTDIRGWSLDGQVIFTEATSGCDFTVWLSAASLMPTFGGICDSFWSCRVGQNVVINYDRWQQTTPAWQAAGGSVDEYRDMVINHETGHRLGFGHADCPAKGQLAPVMRQQSIDLQGCVFNAWPLPSERAEAKIKLGLE